MYELSGIMQQENWEKKILSIVLDDSIRDRSFYKELVKHWKTQMNEIEQEADQMKEYGETIVAPIKEELKEVKIIFNFLAELKKYVDWVNAESLNNLSSSNFQSLINKIRDKHFANSLQKSSAKQ